MGGQRRREGKTGGGNTYHSLVGIDLDERAVEDLAQIPGLGLGEAGEVIQERGVVEGENALGVVDPLVQHPGIADPELADEEDVLAALLPDVLGPLAHVASGNVLHGVQPEALELHLLRYPGAPLLDVLLDLRVRVVQIRKHEVIRVSVLLAHRPAPALVVAQDLVDGFLLRLLVPVRAGEVVPVVLLLAVLVAAPLELEA